jgi:hypothetical protein
MPIHGQGMADGHYHNLSSAHEEIQTLDFSDVAIQLVGDNLGGQNKCKKAYG